MTIPQYLKQKYKMFPNAQVPTEFIQEELHISIKEVRQMVREFLKRRSCPTNIKFEEFVNIVEVGLQ